ncbi:class 1b ribonucleoside-diphosphate reductase subunit beta [Priestia taiwanensis]|uniref:Ribonucleoside-diphosphate reductase subunit beta n=1 Tax=Priestia taiwanensis TaxID=1347902 RepID=A0A917AUD8_9BACI|nr:class 1b ribonucleoside-diphosphate reductase subunit beta [Priestia taiwanensis]MBM7363958.1 ribonucleoside-diphosphate reductase beta chain [Priestia taiwanensis]GGE70487.1 ribonucleoside-diphosphate reductase subunit beta [Priestia taiwanensis]
MRAVNWNKKEDDYSLVFWKQNIAQFWTEEEIAVSSDMNTWMKLSEAEQETYKKVLGGLTLLDTKQGGEGMPLILLHVDNLQAKSVLAFMGAMEEVHAKSYSHIFTTLATEEQIDEIFNWVDNHPQLTKKSALITERYLKLFTPNAPKRDVYMAMVASVFLESFLFYSGFFYPLYLAGQGKLTASGEIINLIIRDESIHGVFVGLLAQETFASLSEQEKAEVSKETVELLEALYENELLYTEDIYTSIGMVDEVNKFIRYNANKAMMNLGLDPYFPEEDINPIVENGLKTDTKNHDFFSVKGNGYVKATNVEKLADEDFAFNF